jgi:hypothetical protein
MIEVTENGKAYLTNESGSVKILKVAMEPNEPTRKTVYTASEFMDELLTDDEVNAIVAAKVAGNAFAERVMVEIYTRPFIDLDNPKTIALIGGLEATGLIAEGRGSIVLEGVMV